MVNEQDEAQRSAREVSAARAFDLARPARRRERRRVKWAAALVVLVLAVIGVAGYEFAANAGHTQRATAAPRPAAKGASAPVSASDVPASPAVAGTAPAGTGPAGSTSAGSTSAGTAPASSPGAATAPAVPLRTLAVASVTAFGPQGAADGQDPQTAVRALSGDAATPWLSDWYVSPDFFDLPNGTGLLLDMGRTVTVASVQVSLDGRGAGLQLRAGARPAPAWLPVVATVSDAGRVVRLTPGAPVHVRYLLLWFTKLPPDGSGTYQASVYRVTVNGRP